jgi:hypothetical protein
VGIAAQRRTAVNGVIDQGHHLLDFLGSLRPAEFGRCVPGTDLAVTDVIARLLVGQNMVLTALDRPTTQRPTALPAYCASSGLERHRNATLAREISDHNAGSTLLAQFQQTQQDLAHRLSASDLPEVISHTRVSLKVADVLRLLSLEWVLYSDDLTRAVPRQRPVIVPRTNLADAVRLLADIVRTRHPGGSVEIRVAPFVAVQCGAPSEPRHTRGTPPNVVECQPLPFIRLCRGRETWFEAMRWNHLTASGARADLSEWFPLF